MIALSPLESGGSARFYGGLQFHMRAVFCYGFDESIKASEQHW